MCFLFHKWSVWGNVKRGRTELFQERWCIRCRKTEVRFIGGVIVHE